MTAAKTMAQLGRSCARCHEATEAKIKFPRELAPVETAKLGTQMASHQWAAARMWEGLIGSVNDRWLEGARTLAGARLAITAERGELGIADDAARTKLLAARAIKLEDRDARAARGRRARGHDPGRRARDERARRYFQARICGSRRS